MNTLKFSTNLVDRYYKLKFMYDMNNYFNIYKYRNEEVSHLFCLFKRNKNPINGSPGVYMGAGPWWSTEHNFMFSGIFAYMLITNKCISKMRSNNELLQFCKQFDWPLIKCVQSNDDFDVIAALKEASLAPCKAESPSYIAMLDVVIPYMDITMSNYIMTIGFDVWDEIHSRLSDFVSWTRNTQDEILSFYGFQVRKEIQPANNFYPVKYYCLESFYKFAKRNKVYSLDEFAKLKNPEFNMFNLITSFDGPIVPHYEDYDCMCAYDVLNRNEDLGEIDEKELNENKIYNILLNFLWDDEVYIKNNRMGLKDCWGRIIVPPKYNKCIGLDSYWFLSESNPCIGVQKKGKWRLVLRDDYRKNLTNNTFDNIELQLEGLYVVEKKGKYGLYSLSGNLILPPNKDVIYRPSFDNNIVYIEGGKYGIRFENGNITKQMVDELDIDSGLLLSVRVDSKWGYLDVNGCFTLKRCESYLMRDSIDLTEYYINNNEEIRNENLGSSKDGYMTMDEFEESLDKKFERFSIKANYSNSCLGKYTVVSVGVSNNVFYYTLIEKEITFCVDFENLYELNLLDDKYHDMCLSWTGFETERDLLKKWLNENNEKSSIRNWVEMLYIRNNVPCNINNPLKIRYTPYDLFDMSVVDSNDFETFNFPQVEFVD